VAKICTTQKRPIYHKRDLYIYTKETSKCTIHNVRTEWRGIESGHANSWNETYELNAQLFCVSIGLFCVHLVLFGVYRSLPSQIIKRDLRIECSSLLCVNRSLLCKYNSLLCIQVSAKQNHQNRHTIDGVFQAQKRPMFTKKRPVEYKSDLYTHTRDVHTYKRDLNTNAPDLCNESPKDPKKPSTHKRDLYLHKEDLLTHTKFRSKFTQKRFIRVVCVNRSLLCTHSNGNA